MSITLSSIAMLQTTLRSILCFSIVFEQQISKYSRKLNFTVHKERNLWLQIYINFHEWRFCSLKTNQLISRKGAKNCWSSSTRWVAVTSVIVTAFSTAPSTPVIPWPVTCYPKPPLRLAQLPVLLLYLTRHLLFQATPAFSTAPRTPVYHVLLIIVISFSDYSDIIFRL